MRCISLALVAIGLSLIGPITDADARSRHGRSIRAGATGAAIGGIAGGGRGAAIGGLVGLGLGSVMGAQENRFHTNYYWSNGRCWFRNRHGEFIPVSSHYCR